MSEWKEIAIGELGRVITGKTPSSKQPEHFGELIPFVTPTDFSNYNKNIFGAERYLSKEGLNALKSKELPSNSLLVTCIGSQMGKVAINRLPVVTNQQINAIIPAPSFVPDYLYYKLSSMQDFLRNLATGGSTMPIVNKADFERIKVELPDFKTQQEIAEILSALDDKIELNNQINANLEALAQAIFKQWFIDFEFPDENGNPYKSSGGKMVESSQGYIPDGWSIQTVEQITKKVGMGPFGANIKVETFVESGIPIISGQHLKETLVLDNDFNYITPHHAQTLKNSLVQSGDVIFTHAGNIGQVAFLHSTAKYPEYIISQRQFYLRPDEKIASGLFFTLFFKSPTGQHKLLANASSTGVPSISRPVSYLRSIEMIVPKIDLMQSFDRTIRSIYESIAAGRQEITLLSNLRGILLPKLISGQISVE